MFGIHYTDKLFVVLLHRTWLVFSRVLHVKNDTLLVNCYSQSKVLWRKEAMQKRTFNHCTEHQIPVLPSVVYAILCPPCSDVSFLSWICIFPVPFFAPSVGLCLLPKLSLAYLCLSSVPFYSPFLPVHIFAPKCLRPCPCPVISKTHMKVRTHNRNTSSIVIGYMYVTALEMQHAWTGWMFRGFRVQMDLDM